MNTSNDGKNNDEIYKNNTGEDERRRKGKGRQKIQIEKIENEANLQVTFSKRRAGIFKKASELNTLCGAESAIVVFSPANKPHSFGHPNMESVAYRFLNANNNDGNLQGSAVDHMMMAHGEAVMHERNQELITIDTQLELERHHKKDLHENAKASPLLDQLTYEELEEMKKYVMRFKCVFEAKLKSNPGETSTWANNNPNRSPHVHQGHDFPAPTDYGNGVRNIGPTFPGGSSSSSFGYPFDNFGYTMQYHPAGLSPSGLSYGNNGENSTANITYDGTRRSSGSGSGTRNRNTNETGSIDDDPDATPQGAPDHLKLYKLY